MTTEQFSRALQAADVSDLGFTDAVVAEVLRARAKFPGSNLVLAALMEEVGELAQAMLKVRAGHWPKERIWEEAVQVAAMAQRVAVEGDPSFDTGLYEEPVNQAIEAGHWP